MNGDGRYEITNTLGEPFGGRWNEEFQIRSRPRTDAAARPGIGRGTASAGWQSVEPSAMPKVRDAGGSEPIRRLSGKSPLKERLAEGDASKSKVA